MAKYMRHEWGSNLRWLLWGGEVAGGAEVGLDLIGWPSTGWGKGVGAGFMTGISVQRLIWSITSGTDSTSASCRAAYRSTSFIGSVTMVF